jgi:RNA polymerase subunit RPABC4/transcription elongation factor Spt4
MNRNRFLGVLVGYVVCVAVLWTALSIGFGSTWSPFGPGDRPGRIILYAITAIVPAFVCLMVGLGMFVFRDARKRGMPAALWTIVAVFVPYFVGLIIYLIVRQSKQLTCCSCGASASVEAAFCPRCGRPLQQLCTRCKVRLPNDARFCPGCGTQLAAAEVTS